MKLKELLVLLMIGTISFSCKETKKSDSDMNTSTEIEEDMPATSMKSESKTDGVLIKPIEHATAVIEWNDVVIYIDPTGGKAAFEGQKAPTLVLITDIHGDHLNV